LIASKCQVTMKQLFKLSMNWKMFWLKTREIQCFRSIFPLSLMAFYKFINLMKIISLKRSKKMLKRIHKKKKMKRRKRCKKKWMKNLKQLPLKLRLRKLIQQCWMYQILILKMRLLGNAQTQSSFLSLL